VNIDAMAGAELPITGLFASPDLGQVVLGGGLRIRATFPFTQGATAIPAGRALFHKPGTLRSAGSPEFSILQKQQSHRHQDEEQGNESYGKKHNGHVL